MSDIATVTSKLTKAQVDITTILEGLRNIKSYSDLLEKNGELKGEIITLKGEVSERNTTIGQLRSKVEKLEKVILLMSQVSYDSSEKAINAAVEKINAASRQKASLLSIVDKIV
ncbi:MAG: hypothetical protein V4616_15070 [Bacteroidota bacterium]